MKRISGVVRRIDIEDIGSFHVYLDCGPAYVKTIWCWIDCHDEHYQVHQCIEGRYKRTHKRTSYSSELIGPVFETYEETRPALAQMLLDILASVSLYSNGILTNLEISRAQVEKS